MSIHNIEQLRQLLLNKSPAVLECKAANGDYHSAYLLGLYYLQEEYLDTELAINCLTKAADNGILPAMTVLGDLYCNGDYGIKVSATLGLDYYTRAASLGDFGSLRELTLILATKYALSGNKYDLRQAEKYARELIALGYDDIVNMVLEFTKVVLEL